MEKRKKKNVVSSKGKEVSERSEKNVCFVISPIGKVGSRDYNKFKETLEYVVKPAIENSGYRLEVIRADDIERAGSFIKDILEYVLDSFVVIADLTGQNANVFYELGVRHSLSPRTILIAQSLDDIPSDLREYRAITYDMTAKGASLFQERLSKYLVEIFTEPHRPDNPVLDRLGSILEQRTMGLEKENAELRNQLDLILKEGKTVRKAEGVENVSNRMKRILTLKNAEKQGRFSLDSDGSFSTGEGEKKKVHKLPTEQGNFNLYFLKSGNYIVGFWYVLIKESRIDYEKELADIRVLMEGCSKGQDAKCIFIIATNEDLSSQSESIHKAFNKMKTFIDEKSRRFFSLEIWDKQGLLQKEKELGIKVDI